MPCSQLSDQLVTGAVRVAVHQCQRSLEGAERFGRRAQRVLIGGQLDGVSDAALTFDFFDRFSGHVERNASDVFRNLEAHGIEVLSGFRALDSVPNGSRRKKQATTSIDVKTLQA
jgi:hypothetical protein